MHLNEQCRFYISLILGKYLTFWYSANILNPLTYLQHYAALIHLISAPVVTTANSY